MARCGDPRGARGSVDPAGCAARAADRRLPRGRGRCRASAAAHARHDPPARACRRSVVPLARHDVGAARRMRCAAHGARRRWRSSHDKTAGNPFLRCSSLARSRTMGCSRSIMARGAGCGTSIAFTPRRTDNVDLMVGKLHRLPVDTQEALQQLACLGNTAALSTACSCSRDIGGGGPCGSVGGGPSRGDRATGGAYAFIHDRVQEAAYALIPEERCAAAHLRIGRLLAAHTPPGDAGGGDFRHRQSA